jgi:hypothetical protein
MDEKAKEDRERREKAAVVKAQQEKRSVTYTDTDGCEITVTPAGHVFYNASDWW